MNEGREIRSESMFGNLKLVVAEDVRQETV